MFLLITLIALQISNNEEMLRLLDWIIDIYNNIPCYLTALLTNAACN